MVLDWFQIAGIFAIIVLFITVILMGKRIGVLSTILTNVEDRLRYLETRERRLRDLETRAWKEFKQMPGIFKRITGN